MAKTIKKAVKKSAKKTAKVQEPVSRIPATHPERKSLYDELKPVVDKDYELIGLGKNPDEPSA